MTRASNHTLQKKRARPVSDEKIFCHTRQSNKTVQLHNEPIKIHRQLFLGDPEKNNRSVARCLFYHGAPILMNIQ
jgi:hypothetical protein